MKTDLCADDMVVRLATPQMIVESPSGEGGGAALGRGGAAALACGRRLLLAARVGDTDTVRLLMAKGAPFSTDWLGTSPLHLASANDHVDTVAVLLRAGVSRDARTKVERTPLHVAAYAGHVRVVRALLEAGAGVDARDLLRMTPLHWAVERGHAQCARVLLRHGADPHAMSKFRKTPLSLAADRPEMRRIVEEAIKENEALRSVDAITAPDRRAPEPDEPPVVVRVEADGEMRPAARPQTNADDDSQRPKEIYFSEVADERQTKPKATRSPPERSKAKNERGSEGGGAEGGTAAALLRRHGITLLPTDDGSTVLSALQSGRTVVLSDAGKLMLKESGAPVAVRAAAGAKLLRAPPRAAPAADDPAPTPDLQQQVKLVQVSGQGGEARPAVRIVMNRRNYRKLLLTAARASAAEAVVGEALADAEPDNDEDAVVVVPEQFVRSTSAQYLRSQLLCAHAAIQHLARRLRAANARAPPS